MQAPARLPYFVHPSDSVQRTDRQLQQETIGSDTAILAYLYLPVNLPTCTLLPSTKARTGTCKSSKIWSETPRLGVLMLHRRNDEWTTAYCCVSSWPPSLSSFSLTTFRLVHPAVSLDAKPDAHVGPPLRSRHGRNFSKLSTASYQSQASRTRAGRGIERTN